MVEIAFWTAAVVVVYHYLGYPAIIWVLGRLFPHPHKKGPITPTITVLIAACNEGARIADKIENCLALDYPPERCDVAVISDGSTDGTEAIVGKYAKRYPDRVKLISIPAQNGKANALNVGAVAARGEILLLADTRQRFESTVARALARNFADPNVGAVSGELILVDDGYAKSLEGLGLYWRYEKALRQAESRFGSTVVYTGAVSAVRRSLFTSLPKETLVDDLVMPLRLMAKGYRVTFEPEARAADWVSKVPEIEFSRKVRTLAGLLQTFLHVRQFIGPLGLKVWWQFVSHKVLRLFVPYALIVAFATSVFLNGPLYRAALGAQVFIYGLGIAGLYARRLGRLRRIVSVPSTFLMLNLAAVIGTFRYFSGRRLDLWQRSPSEELS